MFKSFFISIFFAIPLLINSAVHAKEIVDSNAMIEKVGVVNVVNVNTATAKEIATMLTGIGVAKSKAIVEFREKNGKFVDVESLVKVKGISAKLIEKNRGKIVF